ncbi:nucleotidyl transferase AbiEii/AbiGii toxin family protein [Arachidicoccus terrestris]|uniref:nucleotidyl transferase AbiEii/AbiGii toxin family protein n=1 Tax=Arachidicoccus terrestris TaxID=2875539 RepID=UPI001CC60AF1|nr:nucleotidyl transferase AbiEii/AbiGii toxin family protein [Arachidicoccus terrestris]UAY55588.1 nucleotidyl transferase AbiEii/AbiGii toxin family protein [Arachidicoccus terrestris]
MQQDLLTPNSSFLADQSPDLGFMVRAVSPMQVLTEKMLLLHELYQVRDLPARLLPGSSRHLYDIVRLYEQLQSQKAVIDESLYRALRRHRQNWFGRKSTVYRSSTYNKLCFIPPCNLLGLLMDDYRRLRKEVLFDQRLTFPALIGKIQQINASINGIEWPYMIDQTGKAALSGR